jgi:DNA-binding transcriptional ArsR family regulator
MHELLALLGHPDRLRIVETLLEKPLTQEALRQELALEKGSTSKWVAPLLDARIVERSHARGVLRVRDPDRVRALLLPAAEWQEDRAREHLEEAQRNLHDARARVRRLRKPRLRRLREEPPSDVA